MTTSQQQYNRTEGNRTEQHRRAYPIIPTPVSFSLLLVIAIITKVPICSGFIQTPLPSQASCLVLKYFFTPSPFCFSFFSCSFFSFPPPSLFRRRQQEYIENIQSPIDDEIERGGLAGQAVPCKRYMCGDTRERGGGRRKRKRERERERECVCV